MVERFAEPCDAVVFLQTIEHVADAGAVLDHVRAMLAPGGAAYVSTPNVLTLAPPGAERSGNPWHVREYRPEEFRALCAAHFAGVELHGLFHARKLALHGWALRRLRWDDVHARLGLTKPFYDCFVPAISTRDFALRADARLAGALDFARVRSAAVRRGGVARARPPHAHALRRGLRDVAVRRGVAVGGDRYALPAAARRARARSAGDALGHARACRPARGAGRARALPGVPARGPPRDARARRRGAPASPRVAAELERPRGDYAGAARALRRSATTCRRARAARARGQSARRTPCCRCWRRTPALRLQVRAGVDAHRRAHRRRLARRVLAARVRARAVARAGARGGRASTRRASTSPTSSAAATRAPGPAGDGGRSAARPDRPRDDRPRLERRRLSGARRPTATRSAARRATTTRGPTTAPSTTRRARCEARGPTRRTSSRGSRVGWPAAGCASARSTPSCSATGGPRGRPGCGRSSPRPRAAGSALVALDDALASADPAPAPPRARARDDVGLAARPVDVVGPGRRGPRVGGARTPSCASSPPPRRPGRARCASSSRCRPATGPSRSRAAPPARTRAGASRATSPRCTRRWRTPTAPSPSCARSRPG